MRPPRSFPRRAPSPRRSRAALLVAGLWLVLGCAASSRAPDDARALRLATFDEVWATVRDQHFDPDLNGVDWDAVRTELRPRAASAASAEELQEVVDEMLGRLGQSHFALMPRSTLPPLGGPADDATPEDLAGDLGLELRVRDGLVLAFRVAPGGPAEAAGVQPGWALLEHDGRALGEHARRVEAEVGLAGRRAAAALALRTEAALVGRVGSRVRLRFRAADDAEVELELERAPRDVVAHSFGTSLPTFYLRFERERIERGGVAIGRIRFSNWFVPVAEPLDAAIDALRDADGLVIDLRGNTGGLGGMTSGLAGHFVDRRTELGTQTTRDGLIRYVALPRRVDGEGRRVEPYAGLVAILIDETSGSASEVFAGGMRSTGRARVFGEASHGSVLPATMRTLPNGDALLYAFGDFKTSTGEMLEGRGVQPDVEVPLTRAGLLADGDPALEAAIAWIVGEAR